MIVEFTKDGTAKTGDDQPVFFVSDAKDWQKFSKTLLFPQDLENTELCWLFLKLQELCM
jgi:hypothetical protein